MLEPCGGAQRSTRQRFAALRAMGQFQALALSAENHGMVADRIARAQREHRDLVVRAHTGDTFAAENRVGVKSRPRASAMARPSAKRRAAGRIDLGA